MSNLNFLKNNKRICIICASGGGSEAHQQGSECWSETGYAVCGLFRAEVWPQTDDVYDEWI